MIQIELIKKDGNRYILTKNNLLKLFPYSVWNGSGFDLKNYKSKIFELEKMARNKNADEILITNLENGHFRLLNIKHKDYSLDDLIDSVNYCF